MRFFQLPGWRGHPGQNWRHWKWTSFESVVPITREKQGWIVKLCFVTSTNLLTDTTAFIQNVFKAGSLYEEASCLLDEMYGCPGRWWFGFEYVYSHTQSPTSSHSAEKIFCSSSAYIYKPSLCLCTSPGCFCSCLMHEIGTELWFSQWCA